MTRVPEEREPIPDQSDRNTDVVEGVDTGDGLQRHCDCCGRVIVRLAWVAGGRVFCEPECERLYETYWLPRHGRA